MYKRKLRGYKNKNINAKAIVVKTERIVEEEASTLSENVDASFNDDDSFVPIRLKKKYKKKLEFVESCLVCGKIFHNIYHMAEHNRFFGNPVYPCKHCGTKFCEKKQLEHHIEQSHLKTAKKFRYRCLVCGQFMWTAGSLRSHMYHFHNGWDALYGHLFLSKSDENKISLHDERKPIVKKETEDSEVPMIIPLQNFEDYFMAEKRKQEALLRFMKEEPVKTIPCTVCGIKFASETGVKHHTDHYANRTHACKQCDIKFATERQLTHHAQQAHDKIYVTRFQFKCPVCNQVIMNMRILQAHMYHYHEGWEEKYPDLLVPDPEITEFKDMDLIQKDAIELTAQRKRKRKGAKSVKKRASKTDEINNRSSSVMRKIDNSTRIQRITRSSMSLKQNSSLTIDLEDNNTSSKISLGNTVSGTKPFEPNSSKKDHENKERRRSKRNIAAKVLGNNVIDSKALEHTVKTETLTSEVPANASSMEYEDRLKSEKIERKASLGIKKKIPDRIPCPVCHLTFKNVHSLSNHKYRCGHPKYSCEECGTKFSTEKQLDSHVKLNRDGDRARACPFKCPVCGELMAREKQLQSHIYHYHNGCEDKYPDLRARKSWTVKSRTTNLTKKNQIELENEENSPIKHCESEINDISSRENYSSETSVKKKRSLAILLKNDNSSAKNFGRRFSKRIRSEQFSSMNEETTEITAEALENNSAETKNFDNDVTVSSIPETSVTPSLMDSPDDTDNETNEIAEISDSSVESELPDDDVSSRNLIKTHLESREIEILPSIMNATEKNSTVKSVEASKIEIILISDESNHSDISDTNDKRTMNEDDQEGQLRTLHSCKECFVSLPRLDIKRIKEGTSRPSTNSEAHSSNFVFPSTASAKAPLIDLSMVKTNYCKNLSKSSGRLTCTMCDETFNTEAARQIHVDERHTVIPSILCNKMFTTKASLYRHYRERHFTTTDDNLYCVCGMEFLGQTEMHRHFYKYSLDVILTSSLPKTTYNSCKSLPTNYRCEKCGAAFWLPTCLKYHQTLDCAPSRTVETITSTAALEDSQTCVQTARTNYTCDVCEKTFSSSKKLYGHLTFYSRPDTHPCHICGTGFKAKLQLSQHYQSAHDSSKDYPYRCCICNQGFHAEIMEHQHRMHYHKAKNVNERNDSEVDNVCITDSDESDDEVNRKCDVCDLEFSSNKRLVSHLIYYTKSEIIECNICLEEFEGQYKAHHHNKLVHYSTHSKNAFYHLCTICQEGFMWKTQLQGHLCHVHGIAAIEAQYIIDQSDSNRGSNQMIGFRNVVDKCKICDLSFSSPVILASHEIENMNDGQFVCNTCSRSCRTASILLDHLSLNHSNVAIVDGVTCRRCNENFQTRLGWVSHVKHFHFTKEPSEFYFERNIKSSDKHGSLRFELTIPTNHSITSGMTASKLRTSLNNTSRQSVATGNIEGKSPVRSFIKIEDTSSTTEFWNSEISKATSSENPWKCTICGLICRGSKELAKHMEIFADSGDYMCEFCGRRFKWLGNCEEHKKKHCRDTCDQLFCSRCNEVFDTLQSKTSHDAHIHKEFLDGNSNVSNKQELVSPSKTRSLLRPKLPSIVSFFQSNYTNDSQSEQSVSIHETSNELSEESNKLARLHTEIFEDELSMSYQCPDCYEKFSILEELHQHLATVHNMKQDLSEILLDDSNCSPEIVNCVICDKNFASTDLLNQHQRDVHPLRWDVRKKATKMSKKDTAKVSPKKRRRPIDDNNYFSGKIPKNSEEQKKKSDATFARKAQQNRRGSSMIVRRESVDDASKIVQTEVTGKFRCGICDISFMNKKVLMAHQVKIHCATAEEDGSDSSENIMQQLNKIVNDLPISPKNSDDNAIIDFETVLIPETSYEWNDLVPMNVEFSESSEPIDAALNSSDNPLSTNREIPQLKVRPFARMFERTEEECSKITKSCIRGKGGVSSKATEKN